MRPIQAMTNKTLSRFENQLDRWSARIDQLVAKAGVAGEEARTESRKQIADAKEKLAVARTRVDAAKAAGSEKWESFKESVESSWKELETAVRKVLH